MIHIYCDLIKRTKINNLPKWGKIKIKSQFPGIKFVYSIEKENKKILVYFGDLITKEKIELMPNLKWIHFSSSGTNRAQLEIVKKRKIVITNSPDGFVNSLASLGLAHIFSFARGLHFVNNLRNKKKLNRNEIDRYYDFIDDLREKNILIAGFGKVGKLIANVLKIMGANIHVMVKNNKKTNILDNPGDQDITYHVDFDNFKNILLKKNILNHRIISQAKFLFENGIKERTQVLIDSNPSKNEELNRQLELLTNDKFMGKLFKVLEIDI